MTEINVDYFPLLQQIASIRLEFETHEYVWVEYQSDRNIKICTYTA